MKDGYCKMKTVSPTVQNMKGFVNVTSGDVEALKAAIANHGPVSVAIDAAHKSLLFYAYGVYYEPACSMELMNFIFKTFLLHQRTIDTHF